MNSKLKRIFTFVAIGSATVFSSFADVYTKRDGTSYDGLIYKVLEDSVYLRVGEERFSAPIAEFDSDSQAAIKTWSAENPFKVDIYTKWDVKPAIKSTAMPALPEQFLAEEFRGLVSVDLVLDESGQVIHATVNKSTHADLDAPSLEAAKTWRFEPAQVGGKTVRSKLRVPFKFVNTPPPPAEEVPVS